MAKGTVCWLKIDGVVMPTPSDYTFVEADFDSDSSARSETGLLIRDRIRQGVLSPEYTWNIITTAQLAVILKACKPKEIQVTCFDPMAAEEEVPFMRTFTGYAQATRKPKVVLPRENPLDTLWKLSISFIEY